MTYHVHRSGAARSVGTRRAPKDYEMSDGTIIHAKSAADARRQHPGETVLAVARLGTLKPPAPIGTTTPNQVAPHLHIPNHVPPRVTAPPMRGPLQVPPTVVPPQTVSTKVPPLWTMAYVQQMSVDELIDWWLGHMFSTNVPTGAARDRFAAYLQANHTEAQLRAKVEVGVHKNLADLKLDPHIGDGVYFEHPWKATERIELEDGTQVTWDGSVWSEWIDPQPDPQP